MGYKGKTVILGVSSGGFSERKGGKYFAELVDKLDSRYKIVLIGVNDDDLSYLPYSIKTIKRTNNQAELAEYYSMADIFLKFFSVKMIDYLYFVLHDIRYDQNIHRYLLFVFVHSL